MEHFHYNSHIILLTAQYLDQLRWKCAVFTMKRVFFLHYTESHTDMQMPI